VATVTGRIAQTKGVTEQALPSFADRRQDYRVGELTEASVDPDPFAQFRRWFDDAFAARLPGGDEPHAMTLATVLDGQPMTRIVLLKGLDDEGFVWFTNYESQKGRALASEPRAALNFYWGTLERQVNVVGEVARVTNEESDAYFASRPAGSRIGAIVSAQSTVIPDRSVLEEAAASLAARPEEELVRPPSWGGFRLRPRSIEFWQGRPSRLHDRLRYRRTSLDATNWVIDRLSP
jgi:pyridoxamine 5'-phosphate oxidase